MKAISFKTEQSLPAHIIHPLKPVYNENSRILILGTMPSPSSRKSGFYYGHPQNRFWQVLAAVFFEPLPLTIEEKRSLILRRRLALWDVLSSCRISAADDASIREPAPNDFSVILKSGITHIYTTGQKAFRLYTKLSLPFTGVPALSLPSTSPANRRRWPLDKLIEAYMVLRD